MPSLPLTILDTHRLIEEDVQRLGFYVYDSLESEQVDIQINRQIYTAIDGILDKLFGRKLKVGVDQGFQLDQVSLDNLRKQHVKDAVGTVVAATGIGRRFDLANDYYHLIKAKATISYSCVENGKTITKTVTSKLRVVPTQNIDEMREHPLHKTVKESPLAEIAGNTVYIYTDSTFDVTAINYDYVKKPAQVVYGKNMDGTYNAGGSTHFDIDDSIQYMVVEMTVLKILKIIEAKQQRIVNFDQETI